MKIVSCSDLHVRPDRPRCRTDNDWDETQRLMIRNIVSIANKYNVPLCMVGDLFNKGTAPEYLMIMLIEEFSNINKKVHILAGNHDLPYHSMENIQNSSIGVFFSLAKNHSKIVHGMSEFSSSWCDFNSIISGDTDYSKSSLFIHQLVFKTLKSIPPNCDGMTASQLLEKYPNYKYILTGDNHKCFHYEKDGRHVINGGCTIRQSSDEKSYKPSVFYVDTEKEIVERIYLDDNVEMIDDEYLQKEEERDNRITAFVEGIKKSTNISLSIIDNIEKAIKKNNKTLDEDTIKMIRSLVEGE
ncbi:MAG: metallophosphoesterase [Clostridia bacterium]